MLSIKILSYKKIFFFTKKKQVTYLDQYRPTLSISSKFVVFHYEAKSKFAQRKCLIAIRLCSMKGISAIKSSIFRSMFTEHCSVLCLVLYSDLYSDLYIQIYIQIYDVDQIVTFKLIVIFFNLSSFNLVNPRTHPLTQLEIRLFKGKLCSICKIFKISRQITRVVIDLTNITETDLTKWFDLEEISKTAQVTCIETCMQAAL